MKSKLYPFLIFFLFFFSFKVFSCLALQVVGWLVGWFYLPGFVVSNVFSRAVYKLSPHGYVCLSRAVILKCPWRSCLVRISVYEQLKQNLKKKKIKKPNKPKCWAIYEINFFLVKIATQSHGPQRDANRNYNTQVVKFLQYLSQMSISW